MRNIISIISFLIITSSAKGQSIDSTMLKYDPGKKMLVVETACGECRFKMEGKGCDLAVKVDGKTYFVDGSDIDSHGDAHAKVGFCNAIRKAEVQGEVVNNRFKVTYFKLLKEPEKKEKE